MSVKGFKVGTAASEQYDYNYLDNKPDLSVYATKTEMAAVDDTALAAYPSDTATGAIASFSDGADGIPMKSVLCAINPVQDLHGYDNPWPAGGGKNLLEPLTGSTKEGTTLNVNADGSCYFSGSDTSARSFDFSRSLKAGTYILSGAPTGSSQGAYDMFVTSGGSVIARSYAGSTLTQFTLAEDSTVTVGIRGSTGTLDTAKVFYPMIRLSSIADDTFAPYDNICPISGFTGLTAYRTGVNVWDEEWVLGGINASGADSTASGYYRSKNYISLTPSTTYYFKCPIIMRIYFYDANKTYLSNTTVLNNTFTTPAGASYARFKNNSPDTWTPYDNDISINYPSTDTDYHAYSGTSLSISWQSSAGTVYGGTLDVVSGLLTVAMASVDLGTLFYTYAGSENRFYSNIDNLGAEQISPSQVANAISSALVCVSRNAIAGTTGRFSIHTAGTVTYLTITSDQYTDAALFRTAMSGVQLVYELATPQTYQLTPTEVDSLLGDNALWHDANGNTTANYRADTTLYIDKKIAALGG